MSRRIKASIASAALGLAALLLASCGLVREGNALLTPQAGETAGHPQCEEIHESIASLPKGALLPDSLRACDSKLVASALTSRLEKQPHTHADFEVRPIDEQKTVSAFDPASYGIEIRFNPFILPLIIESGILNLHQVGMSLSASNDPEGRALLEDSLIGLRLEEKYKSDSDNPIHAIRPKYGYLNPHLEPLQKNSGEASTADWLYFQNSDLAAYGCLILKLRDETKSRTTWTYGDSLAQFQELGHTDLLASLKQWIDPPRTLLGASFPIKVSTDREIRYLEAQIWGNLTFADVQTIIMDARCGFDGIASDAKAIKELRDLALSTNKPVFLLQNLENQDDLKGPQGLKSLGGRLPLDAGRLVRAYRLTHNN